MALFEIIVLAILLLSFAYSELQKMIMTESDFVFVVIAFFALAMFSGV
ncbi:MAG: hypothetical protein V1787_01440 [Candidatus Micrarchaeota archaeon]